MANATKCGAFSDPALVHEFRRSRRAPKSQTAAAGSTREAPLTVPRESGAEGIISEVAGTLIGCALAAIGIVGIFCAAQLLSEFGQ